MIFQMVIHENLYKIVWLYESEKSVAYYLLNISHHVIDKERILKVYYDHLYYLTNGKLNITGKDHFKKKTIST